MNPVGRWVRDLENPINQAYGRLGPCEYVPDRTSVVGKPSAIPQAPPKAGGVIS